MTKTYNGTLAAAGTAMATAGTQLFGTDTVSGGHLRLHQCQRRQRQQNGHGQRRDRERRQNSGGNYNVTYVNNSTSTINRADLTFVGTIANKTYDGTTAANLSSFTLSGLIGDQTLGASAETYFLDQERRQRHSGIDRGRHAGPTAPMAGSLPIMS